MEEREFIPHSVNARTNLLDFVNQNFQGEIYKEIGKRPEAWLEELSIINNMLTGRNLCGGSGMFIPPTEDPNFRPLGNNSYVYLGPDNQLKGLWIKEDSEYEEFKGTAHEWMLYRLGTRASLFIHPSYQDIDPDDLLPENFEPKAKKVEKENYFSKRPIWKFPVRRKQGQLEVYAKGSDTSTSVLVSPPYYRLTRIGGITRTTSEEEMETTLNLRNRGVNVPGVVGHYKSDFEQFLFLESAQGEHPDECLPEHKKAIIGQDARMLASICLSGYRKIGFTDFDDKLFAEDKLWLIDVDECRDLYFLMDPKWRDILLDSSKPGELRKFRAHQKQFFKLCLKDTIYNYRGNLLTEQKDSEAYVKSFFERMGWSLPKKGELRRLTTFPANYQTIDSYMAMMFET